MALTTEELLIQVNILASKTDPATNPDMIYVINNNLNKGLNPNYFVGSDTKIVNAINKLADEDIKVSNMVNDISDKVNSILLDVDAYSNSITWRKVQELMGQPTIIEGLEDLFEGKKQEELLKLSADDIGKVLSVAQDEDGNLYTKAIDLILDCDNIKSIDWKQVDNKPVIANKINLTETELILQSDDDTISSVPLVEDIDIDNIIDNL